jgi:RNA polymerase sigma-70 factor, ECF subfamily
MGLEEPMTSPVTREEKTLFTCTPEQEAIDRAKQGDTKSFEALYGLHKRRVYSLCLRMTASTADAEDLTQEVFLLLYRKIVSFRGDSAFSTWLHRITVNVVLMRLRKKNVSLLVKTLEPQVHDRPKMDIAAEDKFLAGSIDRVMLDRSLKSLAPGYQMIFLLHDVEGYKHKEIAQLMRCSIGNSKSQLHKARMKLRLNLQLRNADWCPQRATRKNKVTYIARRPTSGRSTSWGEMPAAA